jgi:hypothetical protein
MGNRLEVEAEFYSDEDSQDARTKLTERATKGLKTDFSITFWVDYEQAVSFESGEKLMKHVQANGYDMSLMDQSIAEHKGYCWIIPEVERLGEFGPVLVGATPGAEAKGVRSLNDLRDGSLAGLTLAEHLETVLAAVQGASNRLSDLAAHREADGRLVSQARLNQAAALRDALDNLVNDHTPELASWRRMQMQADAFLSGF